MRQKLPVFVLLTLLSMPAVAEAAGQSAVAAAQDQVPSESADPRLRRALLRVLKSATLEATEQGIFRMPRFTPAFLLLAAALVAAPVAAFAQPVVPSAPSGTPGGVAGAREPMDPRVTALGKLLTDANERELRVTVYAASLEARLAAETSKTDAASARADAAEKRAAELEAQPKVVSGAGVAPPTDAPAH